MDLTNANKTDKLINELGANLKNHRVLIADKHVNARTNMRQLLLKIGITHIQMAITYAEVLQRIQEDIFDIIIADYYLEEGRDGLQLLEEIRELRLAPSSTVYVITTAERTHQNVIAIAEFEPDAYVLKPFTPDKLHDRLVRAIQKKAFLKPALDYLDQQHYGDALIECDGLLLKNVEFQNDALRLKGEILNILARYEEARDLFSSILANSSVPFAKIGLAKALKGLGKQADAQNIASTLVAKNKEFMGAYDFLAELHEEMGLLPEAQSILQQAAGISPKNARRHENIGHIAVRNADTETAEKSYSRVVEARRGSLLSKVDDYANLARVSLSRGRLDSARKVVDDMQRDLKKSNNSEFVALTIESLCLSKENLPTQAAQKLQAAARLRENLIGSGEAAFSQKITIDFAHACLNSGDSELANDILSQVAAENHEDQSVISQIQEIYANTGKSDEGQDLLARVGREIVELNNSGVLAARGGNLAGAVNILIETAERVPNILFLVNAAKAIFTLIDKQGWEDELAERGINYLRLAYQKDKRSNKVISAVNFYQLIAKRKEQIAQPINISLDQLM